MDELGFLLTLMFILAVSILATLGYHLLLPRVRGRFSVLYLTLVVFTMVLVIPVLEGERLGLLWVGLASAVALLGYWGWWRAWPSMAHMLRRHGYWEDW